MDVPRIEKEKDVTFFFERIDQYIDHLRKTVFGVFKEISSTSCTHSVWEFHPGLISPYSPHSPPIRLIESTAVHMIHRNIETHFEYPEDKVSKYSGELKIQAMAFGIINQILTYYEKPLEEEIRAMDTGREKYTSVKDKTYLCGLETRVYCEPNYMRMCVHYWYPVIHPF